MDGQESKASESQMTNKTDKENDPVLIAQKTRYLDLLTKVKNGVVLSLKQIGELRCLKNLAKEGKW